MPGVAGSGSFSDTSPQTNRVIARPSPEQITSAVHESNGSCMSQEEMDMEIVTRVLIALALWLLGTLLVPSGRADERDKKT
jgi:hypothetical protein